MFLQKHDGQKKVQQADDCIGSLSTGIGFVNQVVYLCIYCLKSKFNGLYYLPALVYLTANAKYSTFPWC